MSTIKERRTLIEQDRNIYFRSYLQDVYFPAIISLTEECESAGHVNLETITRDDGSQYYICDNCRKQVELN
jgi:hypothetical protein